MSRALVAFAALLLVLLTSASPAPASAAPARRCAAPVSFGSTRTAGAGGLMLGVDLDALTDSSAIVAFARVESFRACAAGPRVGTVTEVTLAVEQPLKGAAVSGTRLTVDIPGGHLHGHTMLVGTSAEFFAGERALVFLRRLSNGRLHTTADFQGKLSVDAGGVVESFGLPAAAVEEAIAKAVAGSLPAADDPLASSAGMLVEPAYVTFASWDETAMPVPFSINAEAGLPAQLTAAQTQQAWSNAFATWEDHPGSSITFQFAGTTTRGSEADECLPVDGNNDVTWGLFDSDHPAGVLAITISCLDGSGDLLDAEIEFDIDHFGVAWRVDGSGDCASGVYDLETVALHEAGHFIGLGHPSGDGCTGPTALCPVMNAIYTGVLRALCFDDIVGAAALYPAGVGGVAAAPEIEKKTTDGSFSLLATALAIVVASGIAVSAVHLGVRRRRS